ncbi:related to Methionine aminopeptidase 2 [Hanseniaspora guilliermondii]|uniref:Methionine aminopeptidase 2 n=1 Tax=Hanseniaspora guilliermondii TaxID=56406 RepID=A0A1L0CJS5_9ASCO|nr:related to Methionine aminopeptidase 2 [Hanseniaspora guilliermondii]
MSDVKSTQEALESIDIQDKQPIGEKDNVTSVKSKNKKKKKKNQDIKPIHEFFPKGTKFPEGKWLNYDPSYYYEGDNNLDRTTKLEERYNKSLAEHEQEWDDMRQAAEIHRRVRQNIQKKITVGMKLIDIVNNLEDNTRKFTSTTDITQQKNTYRDGGIGFPTGISINEVAAHYTPNRGDNTVLQYNDIMKLDFGVHINGNIIDSAWTTIMPDKQTKTSENNPYQSLLKAVRDATDTGIKAAGIDVRLCDIGEQIQEVMESYEVDLGNGEVLPVKCCRNLCGHNIKPYTIHGGKSVPIVKNSDTTKMEEFEHFAIETFGTTGRGYVYLDGEGSHYAINMQKLPKKITSKENANVIFDNIQDRLLKAIWDHFGSLPWCKRYLDKVVLSEGKLKLSLDYYNDLDFLVMSGYVQEYLPLVDIPGSMTAQAEHTILLHPHKKEIVSYGEDY